jgi:hypothetical protein
VTTIVGLPTTTNVAWDGTDTPATATGWRTDILISNPTAARASLDTSRNRGTSQHFGGMRCNARPRPHEVCYEMQPSNTKHLGTWNASPDARGPTMRAEASSA